MTTKIHMCVCIDGLLRKRDRELNGLFTTDDGFEINAAGARKYLCEQKALGRRVLPMGECDNFDYQEGCKGHPVEDATPAPGTEPAATETERRGE